MTKSARGVRSAPRIVVLGGGFAGLLAATRIGRALRGRASIRLINERETFVERVRLHQVATAQEVPRPRIVSILEGSQVSFTCGVVSELDLTTRHVHVRRRDGSETVAYDLLVCGLGSTVDLATVPGVSEHCASLANEAAALDLGRRLARLRA